MTPDLLPVGVVGAGNMGANHIRVYDELPGAELVEVVEPKPEHVEPIREQYDVDILEDISEIDKAKAVTVAVPNKLHREVGVKCIDAGLDVLIEKPLAITVEDAEAIVEAAQDHCAVLQVGHIERFNPAIEILAELLDDQELISLEAHRLGPFNEHLTKESVIFDLMIHDLDIIDSLVTSPIDQLYSLGSTTRSSKLDYATAQFKFDNNVLGLTASSHVTNGKIRTLDVTTRDAYIRVNYLEQAISVQRRGTEETTNLLNHTGYRTEMIQESPYIQNREPLRNELEHFLECVRNRTKPRVPGQSGVRAVELATAVAKGLR